MFHKSMVTEKTNTPETTKEKIIHLLEKSKQYVWMSSGLNTTFYNDKEIISAMTGAFKRDKEVRIIIQGDIVEKRDSLKWLFDLKNQFGNKIQIRQIDQMPHWLIADGKHFRLEKPHGNEVIGMKNLFVTDVNQPIITDVLERKFENWWNAATPME